MQIDYLEKLKKTVLVGTEFTFRQNSTEFEFGKKDEDKIKKIISSYISNWRNELNPLKGQKMIYDEFQMEVTSVGGSFPVKVEVNFSGEAIKSCSVDGKDSFTWWFQINVDSGCIELQTMPLTYNCFKVLTKAMDFLIFNIALKKLNLIADKDVDAGGGGHISLDAKTTFNNDPMLFWNFIVKYSRLSLQTTSYMAKCRDKFNASFFQELYKAKGSNAYDVLKSYKPAKDIDSIVKEINRIYMNHTLLLNEKGELVEKKGIDSSFEHYQAINLEHMFDITETERRIEMRRFNAQENIKELLSDLDNLYGTLKEAHELTTYDKLS